MGLLSFLGRLDRWAGRFNEWFGATAEAAHIGAEGAGRRPGADPAAVVALLGEMQNDGKIRREDQDESHLDHRAN
jgi:hypothetical protein